MNNKEIILAKAKLQLTRQQRSIIVGTILGDGHLETQNSGRTYRLKVEHSIKQIEYVEWLYEILKEWVPGGIYKRERRGFEYVGFTTYSHGDFRFYGQQFYTNGVKIIPKMIPKMLDPLALAVWFMDDGSIKSKHHDAYLLHTLCFTQQDQKILQEALLSEFKIETSLHKQPNDQWRMYIGSKSAEMFRTIIDPYISQIVSMKYKIGNKNA